MEEKILIKGKFAKINILTGIFCIFAMYLLIPTASSFIHYNKTNVDGADFDRMFALFFICLFLAFISHLVTCKNELTVTNRRVYGRALLGTRVDLPFDKISSVSICLFKGVGVATSSGKIFFLFCNNDKEVFETISKILLERQEKIQPTTIVKQEQSSADELKKYKDLLDSGIITQEEFDQKKKQLLGL